MQNEKCATRKNSIRKVYNTKKCNMKKSKTWTNCKKRWVQDEKVQHEVSETWSKTKQGATWKKCNTEKVQHERNTKKMQHEKKCNTQKVETWNKYKMNKVQHEILQHWKKCNMPIMQLDRSATKKECNMKKVKHENGGKSEIWKKNAKE